MYSEYVKAAYASKVVHVQYVIKKFLSYCTLNTVNKVCLTDGLLSLYSFVFLNAPHSSVSLIYDIRSKIDHPLTVRLIMRPIVWKIW